jgi:hypothetical protein
MVKDKVDSIKIHPIVYIAIILSIISLIVSGYGLTIEGPKGPQGIQGLQGEQGLQGPPGPAGEGDGHSLDASDGSPSDVVFVDENGFVGIGTLEPIEKLDVDGNIMINGEYQYFYPKTHYLNIPAIAFRQRDYIITYGDYTYDIWEGQGIIPNIGFAPYDVNLWSPLYLPDGVVVKNITVYYVDDSGSDNLEISMKLYRRENMGWEEEMASIGPITSGFSTEWKSSFDNIISNDTIDNQNYQYYIRIDFETDGNVLMERFGGCRIEYTMNHVY